MAKKEKFDYFGAMEKIVAYACEETKILIDVFHDFHVENIMDIMYKVHGIENDSDKINHEIFDHIASEFITPIDRDDMLELTQRLDEVVDRIDDIALKLYMFNIQTIDSQFALEMLDLIDKETNALRLAMIDFKNFKKSDTLDRLLVDVSDYEELADKVYIDAVHDLHTDPNANPLFVGAWVNLFNDLEKCCDAAAHVADLMQTIIIKNV